MITILHSGDCEKTSRQIESDLKHAFNEQVSTNAVVASAGCSRYLADPAWDDLLIVVFDEQGFAPEGEDFIRDYTRRRSDGANLLPVAVNSSFTKPPRSAEAIKSLVYSDTPEGRRRVINRTGAMLGFRMQGRESRLFISYRAKDGKAIAEQLYAHFRALGHEPFLDEAQELDGLPKILPGSAVQQEIDAALQRANMLLLVDTPSAPESIWIKHEVDTADSLLLPVLPLCFRAASDKRRGPRFTSLQSLMRWVPLPLPPPAAVPPALSDTDLEYIVKETEQYYCEIFQRKCRVPFLVRKEFMSRGFEWRVMDQKLLMYWSSKQHNPRLRTCVLTHCSIFDQIYGPALTRFLDFLEASEKSNYALFVYDGELLSEPQLSDIIAGHKNETLIILHHQELATLLQTNFISLGIVQ